jgi:toxin ParE1/3/4
MSSGEAGRYRLTPAALDDLDEVWRFSAERWSIQREDDHLDRLAALFDTIAAMPTVARERAEFTPPVRIHTHDSHVSSSTRSRQTTS